ncbi:MAG TPA: hypothetical protein VEK11_05500 [Thermoanaerobaculia bacterium]|nr:hypothetical protein [Thermoanaerobaculia bacterium]
MKTALAAFALLLAISLPARAQGGICHYWSIEACTDSCERNFANDPAGYDECINLCADSCGEREDPLEPFPKNCPIVIDLGNGTLRFTSAADGVLFDIDGDGQRDALAWTEPESPDGFLALDRNGNGTIDSGLELFGNYTAQPRSAQPHGFRALAVYDESGDGAISASDAVFGALRIWIDANHNGRSEPQELATLQAHGIRSIDLRYVQAQRRDRYGNRLRYKSGVDRNGARTSAVDVFFTELQ